MRKTRSANSSFSDRIRFNWGYHDAANTVQNGWDTQEHFFGFAKQLGEQLSSPFEVATKHFDPPYGAGWVAGYRDAKDGTYRNNSAAAWEDYATVSKQSEVHA